MCHGLTLTNKMRTGKEYKLKEICEFTGLKRTRTHDLVKKLFVSMIVAVQTRYLKLMM